jgi:hypothetical protein
MRRRGVVNDAMDEACPPFDATKSRYDLHSFLGRVYHYVSVIDPRTMLIGQQDVADAKQVLDQLREDPATVKVGLRLSHAHPAYRAVVPLASIGRVQ